MSKLHYFSHKFYFQKSPSAGSSPPPAPSKSSILMTRSCVIWPNCSFSNWLWQNRT